MESVKSFTSIWLYALWLLLLTACHPQDDIGEIFSNGQQWHWSANYITTNSEEEGRLLLTPEELRTINAPENQGIFILTFEKDGSVKGNGKACSFNGTWSAKANGRTVQLKLTPSSTPTGLDKLFYEALNKAAYYDGDAQLLKLFDPVKETYILLRSQN